MGGEREVSQECKPEGRAEILNVLEERGAKKSQDRWCEPGELWQTDMSPADIETLPCMFPTESSVNLTLATTSVIGISGFF